MSTKFWRGTTTSFNTAANWSDTAAPVNGDTLIFNHLASGPCTANLTTTLTGITLIVEKSYTYDLGILTTAGVSTPLVLDGGTLINGQKTGQGSPAGSSLINVSFGTTAATVQMYDSASTGTGLGYYPPVLVKGSSITLYQSGGSIGIAPLTGETATLTAATITKGDADVAPNLYLGRGVTQTLVNAKAGTIYSVSSNTAATTTISGEATYTTEGTGAHTTITCDTGGTVNYGNTGTITTLNLSGTFSNEQYAQPFTVTDRNFYSGASYFIDNGRAASITHTNAYALVRCGLQDINVRTPAGKNL